MNEILETLKVLQEHGSFVGNNLKDLRKKHATINHYYETIIETFVCFNDANYQDRIYLKEMFKYIQDTPDIHIGIVEYPNGYGIYAGHGTSTNAHDCYESRKYLWFLGKNSTYYTADFLTKYFLQVKKAIITFLNT